MSKNVDHLQDKRRGPDRIVSLSTFFATYTQLGIASAVSGTTSNVGRPDINTATTKRVRSNNMELSMMIVIFHPEHHNILLNKDLPAVSVGLLP